MDGRNDLPLDGRIDGWNQKDRSAWQFKLNGSNVYSVLELPGKLKLNVPTVE